MSFEVLLSQLASSGGGLSQKGCILAGPLITLTINTTIYTIHDSKKSALIEKGLTRGTTLRVFKYTLGCEMLMKRNLTLA